MDEHAKQEKASPEIQEETEFRLRSRSIPLPLAWEEVHEFSDFLHTEDGRLRYKKLTDAEKEWAEFLLKKAFDYAQRKQEWYEGLEQLQDEHPDDIALRAALYSAREQITSAVFLAERARTALYVQKFLGGGEAPEELQKRYAEAEAALASQKAENDRLRARVAELENSSPKADVEALQIENSRLRINLEDEEKKNFGLSDELSTRHAELLFVRQELAELRAQCAESFHLRPMWRYVFELERQGKPVDVIREALHGDGFSYPTADALLYDGEAATFDAVKKWGQRTFGKK